jgi:hypothetical protein
LRAIGAAKPAQGQQAALWSRLPGWREIRTRCHDRQHPRRTYAVGQPRQQFERGGIDSMGVFDNKQHRIGFGEPDNFVDQQGDGCCLALCWRQRQRMQWRVGDRQQFRRERDRGGAGGGPVRDQGTEFLDPRAGDRPERCEPRE